MISSDYIHELIVHPEKAGADDLSRLHELTELYPFSSTFSVLYLKALSNCKDVRLESEVEKLAYRVSSRRILYDLLHAFQEETSSTPLAMNEKSEDVYLEMIPSETVISNEPILEVVNEGLIEPIAVEVETITKEDDTEKLKDVEELEPPTETEKEDISKEIPIEQISIYKEDTRNEQAEKEQEEIFVEPVSSNASAEIVKEKAIEETLVTQSFYDEAESEVIPLAIENRSNEKIELNSNAVSVTSSEEKRNQAFEKSADEKELEKLITASAVASGFLDSYVEKLKSRVKEENALKAQKEAEKKIIEVEKNETAKQNLSIVDKKNEIKTEEKGSFRSFSSWLYANQPSQASTSENVSAIEDNTSTVMLKENIGKTDYQANRSLFSTNKSKNEFFSPSKKAKESLDENRMPVSETLARIFVLQGNYPKAIQVYEQLILIIPEKKSFFATQIKILKKKINS